MTAELARAIGTRGLIHGQHADLTLADAVNASEELESIHLHKSGSLFIASVRLPAFYAGLAEPKLAALDQFAQAVGIAFQITDDLLDAPAGGAENHRNLAQRLGSDAARRRVHELIDDAIEALIPFGDAATALRDLASYVRARIH